MKTGRVLVVCVLLLLPWGQAEQVDKQPGVFSPEKLREIDDTIQQSLARKELPGGVFWLEHNGRTYLRAYGNRVVFPSVEIMTEDTIFDAASLTKVLVTTPSIMLLVEQGKIEIDAPVAKYIPEFAQKEKDKITLRHLLTHTSGLRPGLPRDTEWHGYEQGIRLACAERPVTEPGSVFHYSDINFIVLGEVVHRVSGKMLNEFSVENVFRPLKMIDTEFLPPKMKLERIAPTERSGNHVFRGEVHDPTARRMGGVAGHAGVFTTASDLARLARCFLNGGELDGVRVWKPETIALFTSIQSPARVQVRRGLGWDIDSPYAGPRGQVFPIGSFGHTGWTGTSVWIDPFSRTFVILLSNRNHPDESGNVIHLRSQLGTLAAEAVQDFDFSDVGTTHVLNGIDVLERDHFAPLRGLKVGLITNQTGTDRDRVPTIDLLAKAEGVQLVALFSPEHGIRGVYDEKVGDSKDEKTGLPVYSLYGERRSPSAEQLAHLDALVFDIQDVGCRFYTYVSTMGNCLEASAKAKKKFFVLDRVNPIDADKVEGPVLDGETSFTGWHNIPVRYGMTIGELARMFNDEREFHADLTVVPAEGWRRNWFFDRDGLPWINPSPNMRNLAEAILYPGVGLLETTPLSVGRGTDTPFELIGAPYISDSSFVIELNAAGLPGVRFIPVTFTPTSSTFEGKVCKGASIILTDRRKCDVVSVGITIARVLSRMYPNDFDLAKFNRLLVHKPTIDAIHNDQSLEQIKDSWVEALKEFQKRREKYLLYK
ncbi:MAG TPA: exo-beta-N-acetylmuramidase NamZ domain-containing protein [Verrucomicrobiae bacterium]|nr:exo-beta-N-acetylmuramidase NamZ domain-containing protein [Verrucomicrobiae bacterium]